MKKTCKACKGKLTKVINIEKTPPCDFYTKKIIKNLKFYSLDLFACEKCKLIQLTDIVEPNKIYSKYMYKTQHSFGLKEHFRSLFLDIEKVFNKKNIQKNVLDIGCNDGTLLSFFKKNKYDVLGIDPANNIVKDCKKKNIKLLNKFFTKELAIKLSRKKKFNIITANNVMANIPDISEFFQNVSRLLSNNGIFIFETIYGPTIIKNKFIDMINSEHIFYFSATSIENILKIYGLRVIKLDIIKSKGGSIRVYVEKISNNKNKTRVSNLSKALLYENKLGFNNITKLKTYNSAYLNQKKKLDLFLNKLRRKGDTIHGYGASAGSTSIFYHYKLKKFINTIFDDNKLRQGLYLPGSNVKVVDPNNMYKSKPNYILILAWRYSHKIIKNNKKAMKFTKFISILPKLKIIK
jgi:2-polyprenyl-3-methyl-5-hydroxy-6-metoxy-1,4-benzoquinol methylase